MRHKQLQMLKCGYLPPPTTEEDVAGRMGVPFALARKLGGVDKLWKYVPPEQWGKYVKTSDCFLPLSGNGYLRQTNLRAAITWSTEQVPPFHGEKRSRLPDRMLYVFMGNGAGKTHLSRIHPRAQDLDCVWMNVEGSMRIREDAAWSKSCLEPFTSRAQEMLAIARSRTPIVLGQMDPDIVLKAAKQIGISVEVIAYDPGETCA
ncbi:unnamed protein product [Acanthoscelides obtectus]|uniref:Uncharacterized protein n=1 Tax=Acanthoscelides obtectus TaxID=200917 RepID=A0A9P0LZM9_ACAOB|nr:unnamed protein product [Acanthoscelides obtectus]CAK1623144.1 hypothetical protein AOBTE_LOCUS1828 [Acanthoscelides obtectus]